MSFVDLLKSDQAKAKSDQPTERLVTETKVEVNEAPKTPEEVLRGAGFKIRLVTPTSFGTQIDFAKKYDPKEIEKILNGFNVKIKGKSAFVVD